MTEKAVLDPDIQGLPFSISAVSRARGSTMRKMSDYSLCILHPMDIAIFGPATKRFTIVVEGNPAKAPKQYKRCVGHDGRDKTG
jgi:hypothetical protein